MGGGGGGMLGKWGCGGENLVLVMLLLTHHSYTSHTVSLVWKGGRGGRVAGGRMREEGDPSRSYTGTVGRQ